MSDEIMMDIQRTLGRIEQKIDSHVEAFDKHVTMDMEAYKAIGALRTDTAKQKGYMTAMGAIGGVVVTALGYLVDRMFGQH